MRREADNGAGIPRCDELAAMRAAKRIREFTQANLAQVQAWHYGEDDSVERYARDNADLGAVHEATRKAGKTPGTRPEQLVIDHIARIIAEEAEASRRLKGGHS